MKHLLLSLLTFSIAGIAIAQPTTHPNLFYNNGDLIHVQSGAILHVQGDLENKNVSGTKTINNNGIIEVEGNFNNESGGAVFQRTSGEGVVRLIGGSVVAGVANADHEQRIKGDWTTNGKFHTLVIDKQTAGTKVVLETDVEIANALVWDGSNTASGYGGVATEPIRGAGRSGNGVIQLYNGGTDYDLYVSNGVETAVKGYQTFADNGSGNATADQYVLVSGNAPSAVKGFARSVTQTGKDYDFPLATATNSYNGMRLNFSNVAGSPNRITGTFRDGSQGSIGSSCTGCGSFSPDNTGFNYLFTNATASGCSGGSLTQWVVIDQMPSSHGVWSFDGNSSNEYTATAFTSSNDAALDANNARLLKLSGSYTASNASLNTNWGASILSSVSSPNDLLNYSSKLCYTGDGFRGGVYTGFSHFQTAKASNTNNGLPVKLVYLKATPIDNEYIQVSWLTAVEIDNKGFEVYRSKNGVDFKNIGWVAGNGSTTEPKAYAFDDKDVAANTTYYYKLRQVDFDGKSEETNIVSARISNGDLFSVSDFIPNPTNNSSRLIVNTSMPTTVQVKFYTQLGQQLSNETFHLQSGSNDLNFNVENFASATYTAVLVAGNNVYSKKLVVAKN